MSELVEFTRRDEIGVITINNPPVNALSPGVPEGIAAGIEAAAADAGVRAVVVIGGGRTFIAGADIKEFGKITSGERPRLSLYAVLNQIEDSKKPVVMAIHGTAFGGGLEVAMAGHYRVAAPSAQVGQPEVKLGIIPGAAGTAEIAAAGGRRQGRRDVRVRRTDGREDGAGRGILDKIIDGDLLAGAIEFARGVAGKLALKTRERNEKLQDAARNTAIFGLAREQARKTRRGQLAPLAAIDAVEAATRLNFSDGCDREAEIFRLCLFSIQSKALIHAFFGERAVSKIPDIPKDTKIYDIQRAAVIGAGTMGGGIAMNYANAGIPVIVKDSSQEALDRGIATIRKNYENSVKKGRFSQAVMDQRMALITPQLTYDGFDQADIIVEAVFEGMALKKQIFAEIDKLAKPDCILASNTSTLSIDEIASATSRPQMVIGHHFFSPANVMRLLEIVRGKPDRQGSDRDLHGAGEEAEQGRRAGRKLPRVHRQPHDSLLWARSPVSGGRRRGAGGCRSRHLRIRPGHGAAGDGRSGRARRGLAHSQGIQASRKTGRAHSARRRRAVRAGPLRPEDRPGLVQIRREPQAVARSGSGRAD